MPKMRKTKTQAAKLVQTIRINSLWTGSARSLFRTTKLSAAADCFSYDIITPVSRFLGGGASEEKAGKS